MERDLQKLERLRQYAAELQNLIVEAEAAVPGRIEATDRTGTIRMTVGRDSLPETISVAGDWRRALDPGDVAAAVFGAYVACMERRSAAWTRVMEKQEFADRLRDLNEREPEMDSPSHPPPPDGPPPSTFLPDVGHITARPSELVAEDALSAVDAVLDATADPSAEAAGATGHTRRGEVAITLSAGRLVSCEVDPDWAARQTAARLTEALRAALAEAREKLAAGGSAEAGEVGPRLNELLLELSASILNDPRHRSDR